ncbi:MAG: polysaccharide biosynthesis/export family protein [bacterium]
MLKLLRPLLAVVAFVLLAPLATADTGYKIKPGDTLQLEVLEDSSLNRSLLVLPDGSITVPQGGTVRAGGKSVAEVQAEVIAALEPNFAKPPTVYLAVGQLAPRQPSSGGTAAPGGLVRPIAVYVLGEVAKPGRVDVETGTTMLQFLAQAGGFSKFAATKRIQLRRTDDYGQDHVYGFNYDAIMAGGQAPVIYLKKGDVIIVPQRKLFE